MLFTSWQYALLLLVVFMAYWQLPWRGRIWLLLGASYLFYGLWDARFLALLLTSTAIDFFCGLAIAGHRQSLSKVALATTAPLVWLSLYKVAFQKSLPVGTWLLAVAAIFPIFFCGLYTLLWRQPESRQRKSFLLLSILTNLGVLGFFKYFNFAAGSLVALCQQLGWSPGWTLPHIILPVAISFYTFQSIAYSVDIYKGKAQPATDFITFASYLAFFPQLVAGPIERPKDLLPQFEKPAVWNPAHFHRGLRLILIGLFKKVFVADNCAMIANYAFSPQTTLGGHWALLGVVAFAFQIYGDFSGYTDIARGSAELLGIRLSRNFNFPYFAHGPSDFWQRWHITLSSWFRDYVYIPLGGNRCGSVRTYFNLWLTMLLAGLWHGANWTFIVWGAFHGTLLILYRLIPGLNRLAEARSGWRVPVGMGLMFAFTLVGWAIFRCNSLAQFGHWLQAFGHWDRSLAAEWGKSARWVLIHTLPLLLIQLATWKSRDEIENAAWPWPVRGFAYSLMVLAIATSAAGDVGFIYFQF
jgi:alginate O-acetyltransferase complex protein AlgI